MNGFIQNLQYADSLALLNMLTHFNQQLMKSNNAMLILKQKVDDLSELCQKTKNQVQNITSQRPYNRIVSQGSTQDSSNEENGIERLLLKSQYKYTLTMKNQLQLPMYARKNFNILIALQNLKNECINTNNIQLQLIVYSTGKDPRVIQQNRQGDKIIKGNTCIYLTQGYANFQKLSFKEISSKYERGLFHLVIVAKRHMFSNDAQMSCDEIQPLIIKDIKVKAKRIR